MGFAARMALIAKEKLKPVAMFVGKRSAERLIDAAVVGLGFVIFKSRELKIDEGPIASLTENQQIHAQVIHSLSVRLFEDLWFIMYFILLIFYLKN